MNKAISIIQRIVSTFVVNAMAIIGGASILGGITVAKPFKAWILSGNNWVPPLPMPSDGKMYRWDDEKDNWVFMHD